MKIDVVQLYECYKKHIFNDTEFFIRLLFAVESDDPAHIVSFLDPETKKKFVQWLGEDPKVDRVVMSSGSGLSTLKAEWMIKMEDCLKKDLE